MMQKAQISIDFIMTVVAVLGFMQMFQGFSNTYLENATELNIKQQEKLIALQLSSIINETNSLSDGNIIAISYKLSWIYEGDKPSGQDCNIMIAQANSPQNSGEEPIIRVDYIRNESKRISTIQKIAFIPDGIDFEGGQGIID